MARIRHGAMAGVVSAIGVVERRAVLLITTGKKTGRVYRRRGVEHQASAPYEAPASDTSILVNSRRIVLIPDRLRARLVFSAKYARALEHGTKKMKPRYFARRALFETRDEVTMVVRRAVAGALK